MKFLVSQDSDDEIAEGVEIVKGLAEYAAQFQREPISVSKLVVGMKCGGSDGFSGITANPTVGRFSDILISKKALRFDRSARNVWRRNNSYEPLRQ